MTHTRRPLFFLLTLIRILLLGTTILGRTEERS